MAVPIKNTSFLRRKPRVTEVMKEKQGTLTDLSGKHKVKLEWEMNKIAKRDNVIRLTIDDKAAYLDLDELLFYTRTIVK